MIQNICITILALLYACAVVIAIIDVLLDNRSPSRMLGWILFVLTIPFIGVLFYFVFGLSLRQKKRLISSCNRNAIVDEKQKIDYDSLSELSLQDNSLNLIRLLHANSNAFAYRDSDVKILTQPNEIFQSLFSDLESAKEHIHLQFFIFEADRVGAQTRDILIRKAKEGVKVRVIYDYWGSFSLNKKFLKPMKEVGIEFYAYHPVKFPRLVHNINFRNHRKNVVIDGKIAYTGGVNLADRYLYGDSLGFWRDTMVRFEGSVVYGLQKCFFADWYALNPSTVIDESYFPKAQVFDKNCIQIVNSGPDSRYSNIMQGLSQLFATAKKYVYIQTPYFIPTETLIYAIQNAALRGVDVRIIIPITSDASLTVACNQSYIEKMLLAGVKVFLYKSGFLHSKTIVADDEISVIGTANIDFRSYELNYELGAFIYDRKNAEIVKKAYLSDEKKSSQMNLEEWRKRPLRRKLKESISRLLALLM